MTNQRRHVGPAILAGVFAVALHAVSTAARAADDAAIAPVRTFQAALLAIMKDGERLGFAGRRERMQAVVDEVFHLPLITRAVIGRHHDGMDPAERAALGERVREYAVSTLASRFSRHDGERFESPVLAASGAGQARVSSRFLSAAGRATTLDYVLVEDDGRWRIVNVWFDGVSGTDIQRAEFESFLRDGGAERLKVKLDEIIGRLSNQGS